MSLKLGGFELNKYALAITCLFVLSRAWTYARVFLFSLPPSAHPGHFLLMLETIVAGIAGLKGSQSFGGRGNLTGRLLFYVSLWAFTAATFYAYWELYYELGILQIPQILYLDALLANSGLVGWIMNLTPFFGVYALVTSARSTLEKYDSKFFIAVFVSLAFALIFGWVTLVFSDPVWGWTTVADTILWVGIGSTYLFMTLASAIFLVRYLGKWYAAKRIIALVLTVLLSLVIYQLGTSVVYYLVAQFVNPFAAYLWYTFMSHFAIFLICIAITQIKPRMTGPFF